MEEFFAARCGFSYDRLMADERVGFPTVNVRAEFFAPFMYGDVAEVEVFVSRVGDSSVTFEYRLRRATDGVLCTSVSLVAVAMNLDERRSVAIPEQCREAFARNAVEKQSHQ